MIHAGRVEACTVMVYGHLAVDDFVATVAVNVCNAEVVVALTCISFVSGGVAIKYPLHFEVLAVPIVGCEYATGIITAGHDCRRPYTVYIGNSGKETV